jgi:hypothetical protein
VILTYRIPDTLSPGRHELLFVSGGTMCDPTGGAGLGVLGEQISQGSGGGVGGLARTGIEVALVLAVALALLAVGLSLRQAARRRRQRLQREHDLRTYASR